MIFVLLIATLHTVCADSTHGTGYMYFIFSLKLYMHNYIKVQNCKTTILSLTNI